MKLGDVLKVKCIEVNGDGKIRLSKKALEERPEGATDRPPREDRSRGRDRNRHKSKR
jgi:predicted RNA-binding protein with RPS1 domain